MYNKIFCNKFLNKLKKNINNSKKVFFLNNGEKKYYYDIKIIIQKTISLFEKERDKRIIVFSGKSYFYYAYVLSLIFLGKTWIQISPNIPFERIRNIIKVSGSKTAIFDDSFGDKNKIKELKIKLFDNKQILKSIPKEIKIKSIDPKDTAMIFFTSGSTSIPKGVEISYSSFIYSAYQQIKKLSYKNGKEVFSDYHDNSFVMSLNIIFPAVYLNCAISPIIDELDKFNPVKHIKRNNVSILITVPSFFLYLNHFIKKKLKINNLIFCGENFSYNILKQVLKRIKFNKLHNCYGSTELSPWAFFYKFKKHDLNIIKKFNQVPIGKQFEDLRIFINNKKELCVSGPTLSKGYLIKKQNQNKFIFINGKRFYNTGDLSENYNDKFLFITGRNDKQVKVKGYRINTLEIENITKKISGINFCMCFKKKNEEKLVLVIVTEIKGIQSRVIDTLKTYLPVYMIPQNLIFKKKIKLNKNGKVDRFYYINNYG